MAVRSAARAVALAGVGAAAGAGMVMVGTGHGIALTASAQAAQDAATSSRSPESGLGELIDTLNGGTGGTGGTSDSPGSTDGSMGGGDSGTGSSGGSSGKPSGSPTPVHSPTDATPTPAGVSGTFTGDVSSSNPYGPVQVRITVRDGKIVDSQLVQMPADFTSSRISTQAAVYLKQEVLAAQSASISWIGGASLTSPAYIESLASAIAQAGI